VTTAFELCAPAGTVVLEIASVVIPDQTGFEPVPPFEVETPTGTIVERTVQLVSAPVTWPRGALVSAAPA
jgi:hypothetical protein